MEDPDINDPPIVASNDNNNRNNSDNSGFTANEEAVSQLLNFGFNRDQVILALKNTNNNAERAGDWLFSHSEELEQLVKEMKNEENAVKNEKNSYNDGNGNYELKAIISHLGKATSHGHYVAHIKKNNQWFIFNDSKVAKSENPPFAHGYLYLFQRKD